MEGMSSPVEFLSVECDMIFEPVCDLDTDYSVSYPRERTPVVNGTSSDSPTASPGTPNSPLFPVIGELFRHRGVMVYKRTSQDGPFMQVFEPSPVVPSNVDTDTKEGNKCPHTDNCKCDTGSGEGESHVAKGTERWKGKAIIRCEICLKQFRSEGSLLTHSITHARSTGEPHPCPVCGTKLPSRAALKIHLRRHFSVRSYQCQGCHERHLTRTQLLVHQQLHSTQKRYPCNTCDKTFPSKAQCQAHEKTHDRLLKCQCQGCDATFTHRKALVIHERIHTGERPFKCERCGAAFRARSSLWAHRRCHRDRRRHHECPECGSQYWKSSALKRHRQAEHDL